MIATLTIGTHPKNGVSLIIYISEYNAFNASEFSPYTRVAIWTAHSYPTVSKLGNSQAEAWALTSNVIRRVWSVWMSG